MIYPHPNFARGEKINIDFKRPPQPYFKFLVQKLILREIAYVYEMY
jgi:hypothetical protein